MKHTRTDAAGTGEILVYAGMYVCMYVCVYVNNKFLAKFLHNT